MHVKTNVKGGKLSVNHNQIRGPGRGLQVRTAVKGGKLGVNHNQARARAN